MYINKIDDLIDKVIDDFYVSIIEKNEILLKIFSEPNFVKYQKEINQIIINFTKSINLSEIKELVKSNDAVHAISEAIKRYVAFYLFLTIGFNYSSKDETYINNVVEFTKNQPEHNFKIDNFFSSESNALLIKYNTMIKNILNLLDADQAKINMLKTKPDYKDTILFLNDLGSDYITKNFILSNLGKSKTMQAHNMIKTIIVSLMYRVHEKKNFFRLLEMTENLDGEYMFIDIVVPTQKYIDFNSVEKLIGSSPAVKNLAHYLWQFVTDYEDAMQQPPMSIEEKIILLIQSGILYPICDDFLLYHKESERYDKMVDPSKIKKKEDTKIRYIINKIDTTSDYYSEQIKKDEKIKNSIKKNFYVPMLNRKAITVNNNEDIHIINKFLNLGKRSVENNEYFNDLVNYKIYPYINFKDFEKYGFSVTLKKTIDIVRYVSIAKEGEFKQNSKTPLQMRTGSKDMTINVVGFMIPTTLTPIQCLKPSDIIDVRTLDPKNQNGFDLVMKYLQDSDIGMKKKASSIFWLFDLEKDNSTENKQEYDQTTKYSISDQVKHVVSALYDSILSELYYSIISKLEKREKLDLQTAYRVLRMHEKKILKFPDNNELYKGLENKIYDLIEKITPSYDTNEDIIYGLTDDAIKLPAYPGPPADKFQVVKVDLSNLNEYGVEDEKEIVDGICQHNVSWDRISSIEKTNLKQYSDELYDFIQQYVIENVDQEYVCKSCGYQLNIKKYITDGVFDDDTQRFITYSMPMDVPLEDVQEYEKYKTTIRNMDKLIEKIAIVSGIPHLTKSSVNVKWRRKTITKDLIDLLLENNKKLKPKLKERGEQATKMYGISSDLSKLFVFELDNSIFVFSSKDKDQYKPIKQNNIISYMVFLIMLEINDSHITFMGGDKKGLCNFAVFEKILHHLFGGLKIRINSKGELADITEYKILCYLIYIIGCSVVKYNMWYFDYPDQSQKKKYAPILQKMFVHTVVDVINSVLENAETSKSSHLYEMISIKTFKKLEGTFKNNEMYERLQNDGKSSMSGERKDFILTKRSLVNLSGKFTPMTYDLPIRVVCKMPRFTISQRRGKKQKFYNINNITNCPTGQFHEWGTKDGKFTCTLCGLIARSLQLSEKDTNDAMANFKIVRLQTLASKFCSDDGLLHQFVSNEKSEMVCTKCGFDDKHKYTSSELGKLEKALDNEKKNQITDVIEKVSFVRSDIDKEKSYTEKVVEYVKKAYKSNKEQFSFMNELIDELQSVVGKETGSDIFLKENSYVINHDHLGYNLDKNIVITDTNNKIFYKQQHPFFKTDVIYYSSYKGGKIDTFYDATTKILLGYKEESKNFVINKKQEMRLIINYSIFNKLKMLGHTSQFVNIEDQYDELIEGRENIPNIDKENIAKTILSNLVRQRILNLKKVITEFQRVFFRILNNFNRALPEDDSEFFSGKFNMFVDKHRKKIQDLSIFDSKGNHMVFKHWKGIIRGFYAEDVTEIKYDFEKTKTVNIDDVNKMDDSGNMILYFITSEFTKLLKYNTNKILKLAIAHFIIEFINISFEMFNNEKMVNNIDIKRFSYMLASSTYIQEITEKVGSEEGVGIYNEPKDPDAENDVEVKEEITDDQEEHEALDVDLDEDDREEMNEY